MSNIYIKIKLPKPIHLLVETYYYMLPGIMNIVGLIILLIFIFAILGMNLFAGVPIYDYDN